MVSIAVAEMWKSANLAFSLCQMLTMGAAGLLEVAWASSGTIAMKILPSVKRVVDFNVKIRVKTDDLVADLFQAVSELTKPLS